MEKIYAKGIYFNRKHEKQPDFVLGSLSIKIEQLEELVKQIKEYENNGYARFQILDGKEKPYVLVDTYKKEEKPKPSEREEITIEDIPF